MILRILGKEYTIQYVGRNELPNDLGECDDDKQVIKIRSDIHHDAQKDVLLHEVIHAISFQMHAKMTERQVHTIATGLLAVILDNPSSLELLWQAPTICPTKSE